MIGSSVRGAEKRRMRKKEDAFVQNVKHSSVRSADLKKSMMTANQRASMPVLLAGLLLCKYNNPFHLNGTL